MELVIGEGGLDQLLSYDTTFTVGDFDVSILIFRHTFLIKNPCIPALFLVHERNHEECHEHLFHMLDNLVKFPRGQQIAWWTKYCERNSEPPTTLRRSLLEPCFFNDIKGFVAINGGQREEAKVYKKDLNQILSAKLNVNMTPALSS